MQTNESGLAFAPEIYIMDTPIDLQYYINFRGTLRYSR